MRSNTGRPSAVIVFRTFWPTLISVICLEKLRDLSLGPITLFHRPICVSIRLRWLYPVSSCQAICLPYDGTNATSAVRVYLKPYYLPVDTPYWRAVEAGKI